ncbi:CapA family protein [Chitinophaga silvisoli]|uniref:CapA family protein n=1 Tax=Chitinophaga silvisoli TaxID=2291814 RepID=A0A3E1NZ23_9BACT|nr:CapA family protein [Chitinophaga silvisoli]RFM33207.1 CapA family protein [Chitinophaga silvisoli]
MFNLNSFKSSKVLFSFNGIVLIVLAQLLLGGPDTISSTPRKPVSLKATVPVARLRAPGLEDTLSFSIVGDLMVGSSYPSTYYLPPYDSGTILQAALGVMQQTDLRLGNLESCVSDSAPVFKSCGTSQCFAFRTPVKFAQWYKDAGFDYLNLANNHSFDFGLKGVNNTLDWLQANNIRTSGTPQHPTDSITVRNTRIGFVSFAPHSNCLNLNNDTIVRAYIEDLKTRFDLVVVFFHGGAEGASKMTTPKKKEIFFGQDRGNVRHFARLCVDAGADMVIGSGPHVVRGMEVYKEKLIAYSLGNFSTYHQFNLKYPLNIAPLLQVTITKEGKLLDNKVFSFKQEGEGVPKPDSAMTAYKTIRSLSVKDFGFTGVNAGTL